MPNSKAVLFDNVCIGMRRAYFPVSAPTLLVGRQDGHPDRKKVGCWFVGGDDLTAALHVL